jgi:hypothetical protein
LETEPLALSATLDWSIKRAIYSEFARNQGIAWETLPSWNYVLSWLQRAHEPHSPSGLTLIADSVLDRRSPIGGLARSMDRYLEKKGLRWEDLEKVLRLRKQLFEIDTKFSQLGEQGIFTSLDRQRVLAHHFPGVDEVDRAMTDPPAKGRARVRGKLIQQLYADADRYTCDWQTIWDRSGQRLIDLRHPFATEEDWKDIKGHGNILWEDLDENYFRAAYRE